MPNVEVVDTGYAFELVWEGHLADPEAVAKSFRERLDRLYVSIPLTLFSFEPLTPPEWRYRFETVDGRTWEQTLRIEEGQRTLGSFGFGDLWVHEDGNLPAEFEPHRGLRAHCISLARSTDLTKIEATWT